MTSESALDRAKQAARDAARRRRAGAGDPLAAGRRLVSHFFSQPGLAAVCPRGAVVSGYWPRADEIDCRPLLHELSGRGCQVCLPVVVAKSQPLQFRAWGGTEDELVAGPFDVFEPPAAATLVRPLVLLIPLLAFDGHGIRLGYGGGYYDRTLASLRAAARVTAIGVAFAAQRAADLPRDPYDQALDWIVTDTGAQSFDHQSPGRRAAR